MCQTLPEAAGSQTETLQHVRTHHLSAFFQIKEKLKILTRQTLFQGIAICDKFFEKTNQRAHCLVEVESKCWTRVVACLWMGWKFIETDKIPLKKLLQRVQHSTITSQAVIDMEAEILELIDFEIPTEIAYATLTAEFQALRVERSSQVVIASQCLKFLQEALKVSTDFSLCGELGPKILKLYREQCLQDRRIRTVYLQIKGREAIRSH